MKRLSFWHALSLRRRIYKDKGGALIITLFVMMMLTLAAIVAVDTAQTDIELSFNELHSDQAFYLAEAGINRAYQELKNDREWRSGFANVSFDGGTYSVAVVDSSVMPALEDTILVRSTANMDGANANIEAKIVPQYRRPFRYGLFGDLSVNLDNRIDTDSYSSDSGTYADTRLNQGGDVASNGTINITNIAEVGGDVFSAVDGGILVAATATVYGDTASNVPPQTMDTITDAEFNWAHDYSDVATGLSGSYTYDVTTHSLTLSTTQQVTLSDGVYYFSNITMNDFSRIAIAPGADVTIYVSDSVSLGESTMINPNGAPADLTIISKGGMYTLANNTDIWAAIYGPNADMLLQNRCDVYGAIVARTITMVNQSAIHYDRALSEVEMRAAGSMKMIAWQEL